ncbi:YidB family protein [Kitasatospora sp. McL0602]|uniref:YidB family protein n=1 Tax=Kitasatospora sp. McL0602 TaxID=3439530 RepID=UPI003F8CC446
MGESTQAAPALGTLLAALAQAPETAGKFDSWVGGGSNEPLTTEEVTALLPAETLATLAEQAGVSEAEAAASLAVEIPALVDAMPAEAIEAFRGPGRIAALTPAELVAAEQLAVLTEQLAAVLPEGSSWLGEGANQPITEEQVRQAFGDETLAEVAEARGEDVAEVTRQLATTMPAFIDAVSPDGVVDLDLLLLMLTQEDVIIVEGTPA